MRIHFLGTNGWYNTATGETTCVLIDAREAYVVLDAGQGIRKIDQHITDPKKPVYLFLSHLHLDHTYGFHTFPKLRLPQGITVFTQKDSAHHLRTLLASPWTAPIERLKTAVRLVEIDEGTHTAPLPFECRWLVHADPCLGFRLTIEGKQIAYCTDTGVCDGMRALARHADLLIAECAWRVPNERPGWPHLAPEDSATIAKASGTQQLLLMHFDARNYPTFTERDAAEATARAIFPHTRAMRDDDSVTL